MNVSAELRSWRARRQERPLPVVEVDHAPAVPGVVLRVVCLALAATLVVSAVSRVPQGITGLVWLAGGGALAWLLLRPGRAPAAITLCVAAVSLLASPAAPFDPAVWWTAPLGYAVLRTAWWAEQVGPGARVEVAALVRAGGRDVVVVAAALVAGTLVTLLVSGPSAVLVAAGGGALVVLVVVLLRR
ncbi:hypothetical protein [Isoptericola dokdonensis]|uniref:Uncharacterized protein n=1 Tax=Isoptericola dokdonensis DS-3 TaxID=1300344 RepID=A0A168EMT7_9MICO|nr:hypothetical protein [Isoptericola dokdonensis]ANC30238.1 hypothetical protein I598_0658 [Isoptericola dokdonensis DS-3]